MGAPKGGAFSLKTLALRQGSLAALQESEDMILHTLASFIKSRERVFILVHGYNTSEDEAKEAYDMIVDRLRLKPTDGIISFHWDGLVAGRKIGAGKIWFNAAGYSQLAGTKGLRRILNTAEKKNIVIISHSRGASVVMSALGDPPFGEKFGKDTFKYHQIDVYNNPQLRSCDNHISIILLAPAIGLVDLSTCDYYSGKHTLRQLNSQVKILSISVNTNDPALKKGVFASKFNPTDLGCKFSVAEIVKKTYPITAISDFSGMRSHRFCDYIAHRNFPQMLSSAGVDASQ